MSECVVMMNMPKGCGSCPIANFGYCSINHKQVGDLLMGYPENRPASCPILCQLPEGHGRLVDADELQKNISSGLKEMEPGELKSGFSIALPYLSLAPTIIPAEAERSET